MGYETTELTNAPADGTLFAFLLGMIGVLLVIALLMYVFAAIGLYGIAKNQGYDKPWLAWVPFANYVLLAILVEDDVYETFKGKFAIVFTIAFVTSIVLGSFIPFVSIIPTLLMFYAMYFIFDRYSNNVGVNMVIMIITGGAAVPFQLFRYRNRESLYSEKSLA